MLDTIVLLMNMFTQCVGVGVRVSVCAGVYIHLSVKQVAMLHSTDGTD